MQDEWGISDGYFDVAGAWHPTSHSTRDRIRDAMGAPQSGPPLWFVVQGDQHQLWITCALRLEDGTDRGHLDVLPTDLPLGYHDLSPLDGGPTTRLIVHPRACGPIPRSWGVSAQTYALWSASSWGIGDLGDLRALAAATSAQGGDYILISPLHQPAPTLPQEDSPYYPSSRRTFNPLLLASATPPPEDLGCDPTALIDRDRVWAAKRADLEAQFAAATTPPGLPTTVAVWNAICDELGPQWPLWPERFRDPSAAAAVLRADPALARRATFHQWCQERVPEQLERIAATGVGLIGDLAVGFSPNGADAWEYQHVLALDMRIGAPPDPFSAAGQDWGIPPFVPWRLRQACYEPFIQTVRACMWGVAGLRIDHIMGMFRQFWVPVGASPADGAYVHFPAEELLAILVLEAVRAGVFVVGEDLGTVEPHVREQLAARNIACTRVVWFEEQPPAHWPEHCLATVTTHDLPTIAGAVDSGEFVQRISALSGATTVAEVIADVHAALLASPARLRLLSLDDICANPLQPNHPGDMSAPNWRRRLPRSVDDLPQLRQ